MPLSTLFTVAMGENQPITFLVMPALQDAVTADQILCVPEARPQRLVPNDPI